MSIPESNEHGLLPEGIHDCTVEELQARFGRFRSSDRRPRLCQRLLQFIEELRRAHLARGLLINGSFVTDLPSPNDIDLILVLPTDHDIQAELTPAAYNLASKRKVRSRFGFDMFVAREESVEYRKAVEFFSRLRNSPDRRKGILRVRL